MLKNAGAMGIAQFMPSTLHYAVDFDKNGNKNLFGWKRNSPIVIMLHKTHHPKSSKHVIILEAKNANKIYKKRFLCFKNFYVLKRYNNNNKYVMAVYFLAKAIEKNAKQKNK